MPEVAVKINIAPKASRMMMSGISHHFFSWPQKRKKSLNKAHMLGGRIVVWV